MPTGRELLDLWFAKVETSPKFQDLPMTEKNRQRENYFQTRISPTVKDDSEREGLHQRLKPDFIQSFLYGMAKPVAGLVGLVSPEAEKALMPEGPVAQNPWGALGGEIAGSVPLMMGSEALVAKGAQLASKIKGAGKLASLLRTAGTLSAKPGFIGRAVRGAEVWTLPSVPEVVAGKAPVSSLLHPLVTGAAAGIPTGPVLQALAGGIASAATAGPSDLKVTGVPAIDAGLVTAGTLGGMHLAGKLLRGVARAPKLSKAQEDISQEIAGHEEPGAFMKEPTTGGEKYAQIIESIKKIPPERDAGTPSVLVADVEPLRVQPSRIDRSSENTVQVQLKTAAQRIREVSGRLHPDVVNEGKVLWKRMQAGVADESGFLKAAADFEAWLQQAAPTGTMRYMTSDKRFKETMTGIPLSLYDNAYLTFTPKGDTVLKETPSGKFYRNLMREQVRINAEDFLAASDDPLREVNGQVRSYSARDVYIAEQLLKGSGGVFAEQNLRSEYGIEPEDLPGIVRNLRSSGELADKPHGKLSQGGVVEDVQTAVKEPSSFKAGKMVELLERVENLPPDPTMTPQQFTVYKEGLRDQIKQAWEARFSDVMGRSSARHPKRVAAGLETVAASWDRSGTPPREKTSSAEMTTLLEEMQGTKERMGALGLPFDADAATIAEVRAKLQGVGSQSWLDSLVKTRDAQVRRANAVDTWLPPAEKVVSYDPTSGVFSLEPGEEAPSRRETIKAEIQKASAEGEAPFTITGESAPQGFQARRNVTWAFFEKAKEQGDFAKWFAHTDRFWVNGKVVDPERYMARKPTGSKSGGELVVTTQVGNYKVVRGKDGKYRLIAKDAGEAKAAGAPDVVSEEDAFKVFNSQGLTMQWIPTNDAPPKVQARVIRGEEPAKRGSKKAAIAKKRGIEDLRAAAVSENVTEPVLPGEEVVIPPERPLTQKLNIPVSMAPKVAPQVDAAKVYGELASNPTALSDALGRVGLTLESPPEAFRMAREKATDPGVRNHISALRDALQVLRHNAQGGNVKPQTEGTPVKSETLFGDLTEGGAQVKPEPVKGPALKKEGTLGLSRIPSEEILYQWAQQKGVDIYVDREGGRMYFRDANNRLIETSPAALRWLPDNPSNVVTVMPATPENMAGLKEMVPRYTPTSLVALAHDRGVSIGWTPRDRFVTVNGRPMSFQDFEALPLKSGSTTGLSLVRTGQREFWYDGQFKEHWITETPEPVSSLRDLRDLMYANGGYRLVFGQPEAGGVKFGKLFGQVKESFEDYLNGRVVQADAPDVLRRVRESGPMEVLIEGDNVPLDPSSVSGERTYLPPTDGLPRQTLTPWTRATRWIAGAKHLFSEYENQTGLPIWKAYDNVEKAVLSIEGWKRDVYKRMANIFKTSKGREEEMYRLVIAGSDVKLRTQLNERFKYSVNELAAASDARMILQDTMGPNWEKFLPELWDSRADTSMASPRVKEWMKHGFIPEYDRLDFFLTNVVGVKMRTAIEPYLHNFEEVQGALKESRLSDEARRKVHSDMGLYKNSIGFYMTPDRVYMSDMVKQLNARFGTEMKGDLLDNFVSHIMLASYSSAMPFRLGMLARNLTQTFQTTLPFVGGKYLAKGIARTFTKEGWELGKKLYFDELGGVPLEEYMYTKGILRKAYEIGMTPFRHAEMLNRVISANAAYVAFKENVGDLLADRITLQDFKRTTGIIYLEKAAQDSIMAPVLAGTTADVEAAAMRAGRHMAEDTQWLYRVGNSPRIFRGRAGRLLGQFGVWPTSWIQWAKRGISTGDAKATENFVGRWLLMNTALLGVSSQILGVDFRPWLFLGPAAYGGGPMAQNLANAAEWMRGGYYREHAEREIKKSWTSFVPFAGAIRDLGRAYAEPKPSEAAKRIFGFRSEE